jgi:hypothetical protein
MMKPVGLLSILLAASAANAAPTPMSVIASPEPPAIVLAAAGGHDSVGGLIPLPLWPPYTPRVYAPALQVSKHRVRKCYHACAH